MRAVTALPPEVRAILYLRVPFQNHPGQLLQELAQGLAGLRPPVGVVAVVHGAEGPKVSTTEGIPVGIMPLKRINGRPSSHGKLKRRRL